MEDRRVHIRMHTYIALYIGIIIGIVVVASSSAYFVLFIQISLSFSPLFCIKKLGSRLSFSIASIQTLSLNALWKISINRRL